MKRVFSVENREVDIFDFDKTIVPFDSGTLFVVYCMIHYPHCLITLPIIAISGLLMALGIINFTQFKKTCYYYILLIPVKKAVKKFWDKYECKVHKWFYDRPRYSIVISASPDFLLEDISKRLGFDEIISTRYDMKKGRIIGENCRGEEKLNRLFELHKREELNVIDVYSDSYKHDGPIFSLAKGQCYHIEKGKRVPFSYEQVYKNKK